MAPTTTALETTHTLVRRFKGSSTTGAALGGIFGVLVLGTIIALLFRWDKRRHKLERERRAKEAEEQAWEMQHGSAYVMEPAPAYNQNHELSGVDRKAEADSYPVRELAGTSAASEAEGRSVAKPSGESSRA